MSEIRGWKHGPLSQVIASLDTGVSVNAEDRPHGSGEIGILKTSALAGGVFRPEQNKAVLVEERALVTEPVSADSVLVSRMNTPALVGESCYVTEEWPTLFVPDRIWQLKQRDEQAVSMRWLSYVLRSAKARAHIETHATGTSGSMKNLAKGRFLDLPVDYPPVVEQRSIAQVLDTLDTTIRQTEAIIAKLKHVKQGLLHDLLTRGIAANGELRPPQSEAPHLYKASALGWIPADWSESTLGAKLAGIDGGWSPDCLEVPPPEGCWGVLKLSAITSGRYQPSESKTLPDTLRPDPSIEVHSGDVLLARANGVAELVATTVFVESTPARLLLSDKTLRLRPETRQLSPRFLSLLMAFDTTRRQIRGMLNGSSGQQNISQRQICNLVVGLPSLPEQQAIEASLLASDHRISDEILLADKLRKTKSGLMDDLLTGRVRVTPLLAQAPATQP